jgi:hypothetical protein
MRTSLARASHSAATATMAIIAACRIPPIQTNVKIASRTSVEVQRKI